MVFINWTYTNIICMKVYQKLKQAWVIFCSCSTVDNGIPSLCDSVWKQISFCLVFHGWIVSIQDTVSWLCFHSGFDIQVSYLQNTLKTYEANISSMVVSQVSYVHLAVYKNNVWRRHIVLHWLDGLSVGLSVPRHLWNKLHVLWQNSLKLGILGQHQVQMLPT